MGKGKKKLLKGTPPVVSNLLLASSEGPPALSLDLKRRNVNNVLSKDQIQKPVNARSDTGSLATKMRTESRTLTFEMDDADGANDQDLLEDADRLDLDNLDFLEESMLADTEAPEDLEKPPAQLNETLAHMMETEKGNPTMQSMELARKKVSPSLAFGIYGCGI